MSNTPKGRGIPDEIWLQLYGDSSPRDGPTPDYTQDVSWCWHQVFKHDVKYVRADRLIPTLKRPKS